jgi:hypothetical protein
MHNSTNAITRSLGLIFAVILGEPVGMGHNTIQ